MVTAIPVAGNPIVQWLWGGYTVAKCGIGSYSFSCIFSMNADPTVGSKIEFNHSLFDGCAGSKNFLMTFECINSYICLFLQTDKLKLMNLSVSENVLLIQKLNWQSVYGLNSSLFLYDKIGIIVLYIYILWLGLGPDKMCYHIYKDKPTQFQILKVAKRQLTFNAYSFQMLFQKSIKPKHRNNNKYIMHENAIFFRDTMKIRLNIPKSKRYLKSVVPSRFFVGLSQIRPIPNRVIRRSKSEKVDPEHNNNQILDQIVKLKYNKTTKKYHKLIVILLEIDFLEKCYFRIKSKPGNSTPSADGETLDGINLKWFQKISNELKNGTYKPKPSRVVYVPKKNSQEKRRLVINSPRDKIIQEGLRGILSTIYELLFSKYSYGFRQNRGAHNAI